MSNCVRGICEWYLRLRHSRGYGVHSPFAYSLVTEAVHPGGKYAWYGYGDIERASLAPGVRVTAHERGDARLLLRLLSQLGSRRLLTAGVGSPLPEAVARSLGIGYVDLARAGAEPCGTDFLLAGESAAACVEDALRRGCAVMAAGKLGPAREAVLAYRGEGLLLNGTRLALAVPRPGMALVEYAMRF